MLRNCFTRLFWRCLGSRQGAGQLGWMISSSPDCLPLPPFLRDWMPSFLCVSGYVPELVRWRVDPSGKMTFRSGFLPPVTFQVVLRKEGGFPVVLFNYWGKCTLHESQCGHICFELLISFTSGQAANLHSEAETIRCQCTEFLHYVKVFIFRWDLHTIYQFMY